MSNKNVKLVAKGCLMEQFLKYIQKHTTQNTKEMQSCLLDMICEDDEPISLSRDEIFNALKIKGEFFVLKLHYDDFEDELKSQKIKYKISQALSVVVSYEDDGSRYEDIKKFISYIYSFCDDKQNSVFGVKVVDKLSEFPIKILFSGLLPINQLGMCIGEGVQALIEKDKEYFAKRFKKLRDDISCEINIPILPLFATFDKRLKEYEVVLVDIVDGRIVSRFEMQDDTNKENIEIYLMKLFYIYKEIYKKYMV